jgi:hypothetical protein
MTIHYSIWNKASILGVFTANDSQEILDKMESLKVLGEFTYNVFKIEGN